MLARRQFSGFNEVDEGRVIELISRCLYLKALDELADWPIGVSRSWYEGCCFYCLSDFAKAERIFRKLSSMQGCPVEVPLRLSLALQCQYRLEEALCILLPNLASSHSNSPELAIKALIQYGCICLEMGLAAHFQVVISKYHLLLDSSADLKFLDAVSSLFVGDYLTGWFKYQARFDLPWGELPSYLGLPLLTSDSFLCCKQLVFFAEPGQGVGDLLWGLRFVPLLKRFGASILFVGPNSLVSFIAATGLFDAVFDASEGLCKEASHCLPVMSAPCVLGLTSPDEMPSPVIQLDLYQKKFCLNNYLANAPVDLQARPVVALNWQGDKSKEDPRSCGIRGRSFDCSEFETATALRECLLMSVQVGECANQIKASWLRSCLHPAQDVLDLLDRDFLLTAEVLLQCDLLITNDTSIAHLGGLLNIPTWVVLKCFPYWQWGDQGQHNVWYPSIRCFRQHSPGDWQSAMEDVNEALTSLLQGRKFLQETPESPDL